MINNIYNFTAKVRFLRSADAPVEMTKWDRQTHAHTNHTMKLLIVKL